MLKHLLTLAAAALLAAPAFAQVTIGETTYGTLNDAVAAATEGQTITIKGETTITNRVDVTKSITIKGEGNDAKIVRGEKFTASMFLFKEKCVAALENLTFDGANVAAGNKPFEINSTATSVAFTDCKFINHVADRVIFVQQTTTLTNVSAENNTYKEGNDLVFVGGTNKLTMAGSAAYGVNVERNNYTISAGENLNGNINLILATNAYEAGRTIVNNCTDPSIFTLTNAPEGYSLTAQGNNLVMTYSKNIVTVIHKEEDGTETKTSYTSLTSAMEAAAVNDVLVLLEDITVNDRLNNILDGKNRNLTIKGENPEAKIKLIRNFKNKLFVTTNGHFTFENIIFDCNGMENNTYELEDNQGGLYLRNVEIINSVSSKGLITSKAGKPLELTDVTKSNCETPAPDVNVNGTLELSGNCNLSINIANTAAGVITVKNGLTNEEPITLTLANTELGSVAVNGTADYNKFALTNTGFYLVPNKDNTALVLSDKKATGIEDVTVADENAPAEYYSINGIRMNGDNLAPGLYIKRQGSKATKILVK